jgi:hypothetical protein
LEWPFAKTPDGYGHLKIGDKFRIVSQVVCEETHGPPADSKLQAAHSCGYSSCCNPWHISWKTAKENCADKILHGTNVSGKGGAIRPRYGEENGFSKLKRDQVLAIRASDEPRNELAQRYRISPATVKSIKARRCWAWL